jgi:hypothetical protein
MKTTRYFKEQVLRKRPYIRREWSEQVPGRADPEGSPGGWSYSLLGPICAGWRGSTAVSPGCYTGGRRNGS